MRMGKPSDAHGGRSSLEIYKYGYVHHIEKTYLRILKACPWPHAQLQAIKRARRAVGMGRRGRA